ncbi:MAG: AAA family ATPase [Candidatus Hydrogenedens sp.]|nr:AAA family ATPase [Candidatus Hydrogenedens sp.]
MDKNKIEQFYMKWQLTLPKRIEGYIYNENKQLLPIRYIFPRFINLIERFLKNEISEIEKIILMPGIRGIGKSTLLSQIYTLEKFLLPDNKSILKNLGKLDERLYLDVSQLHAEQISLHDFFQFYEEMKDIHFEKPNKKILILLDEVHFDDRWGLFLKNLFDRTKGHKDVLVIATGSSALHIDIIPDLGRRSDIWEMFPLDFSEYLLLKYGKDIVKHGFSEKLRTIIFSSSTAKEVFNKLYKEKKQVDKYFVNEVPVKAEEDFFELGGFPSSLKIENKQKAIEKIKSVIDGIIAKDILKLKNFETHTVAKITDLLYLLAQSDLISYSKLQSVLQINRPETLDNLIEVLMLSGLLLKVKAYGTTYGPTRKTPKYLFITPSLRCAILDNNFYGGIEGKKLEDYFALIFQKHIRRGSSIGSPKLSFDMAEGGADFILTLQDKSSVVIEVGFNKEDVKQVEKTMQKAKNCKYGLVFGSNNLDLINNSIVKIPLRFLLLI